LKSIVMTNPLVGRVVRVSALAGLLLSQLQPATSIVAGGTVLADCSVDVSCSPAMLTCDVGSTVEVQVRLQSGCPIAAAKWAVSFDSDVLRCESVSRGDFFDGYQTVTVPMDGSCEIDNDAGRVADMGVIIVGQPSDPPSGEGVLCCYTFTALEEGVATVAVNDLEVVDAGGQSHTDVGVTSRISVERALETPYADLRVSELSASWVVEGESFLVSYTVANDGSAPANGFACTARVDGEKRSIDTVDSLDTLESRSFTAGPFAATSSHYSIVVAVDADDAVHETDEGNNSRVVSLQTVGDSGAGASLSVPLCQSVTGVGDTFSVDIFMVTGGESSGAQCSFTYDPDVVHCTGITPGTFYEENKPAGATVMWFGTTDSWDNEAGTIGNFSAACIPTATGAEGSGLFATLEFQAVGVGTSSLGFAGGSVAGIGNVPEPLDTTLTGGELRVGEACSNPDLTITDLDCTWVTQGSSYRVNFTLKNEGGSSSPGCGVAIKVDGTTQETVMCPALDPTETYRGSSGTLNLLTDTVELQACADGQGEIAESNEGNNCMSTTWPGLPDAPTGLSGTCDANGKVDLKWNDKSDNEEGFRVERSTNATFPDDDDLTKTFKIDKNQKAFTDNDTPAGRLLYYRVLAYNTNGDSPPTDTISLKTPTTIERLVPPNPPTRLEVMQLDGRKVLLQWEDNASNESEFRIERSTSEDFNENQRRFMVRANDFKYEDTATELGKTYYYRVFARNVKGDSEASNVIVVTLLQSPSDLKAEVASPEQINLTWQDLVANEQGFRIERAADPNFGSEVASFSVGPDVTRFGDIDVDPDATYYYRVVAFSNDFESVSSNVVSATPIAAINKRISPTVELDRVVDMRGMFTEDFVCTRLEGVRQLSATAGTLIRDRTGYLALELEATPLEMPVLSPSQSVILGLPRYYHPFGQSILPALKVVGESDCRLVGGMVKIGPDGTRFSRPVALTLEYDPSLLPAGADPEGLCVAYYNPDRGCWIQLPSVATPDEHLVTAWVSHFSVFAVVMPGEPHIPWSQIATVLVVEVFAGVAVVLYARTKQRRPLRVSYPYPPEFLALPPAEPGSAHQNDQ